jgi:hypothetical protein
MILSVQKKYLFFVSLTAVLGWAGFILIIRRLDPCLIPGEIAVCSDTSSLAMILFFVSLFFALTASFAVLGYAMRLWLHKHDLFVDSMNVALRQGFLLAFIGIGAVSMLALSVLRWWSGLLLIALVLLLELYFTRTN